MQLIFVFSIVIFQIFCIHFGKVVKIVRTLWVYALVYAEKLTVFLGNKSITAVRAGKPERCCNQIAGRKGLPTDFALVLTVASIVVIYKMVRGTA